MRIVAYIDEERVVFESGEIINHYGYEMIKTEDNREFYLFEDRESAGEKAREYWEDMAENDPRELAAILGEECLIAWGLGQNYAPRSIGVGSLTDWLDLWIDLPEEQWASHDGKESIFFSRHPDYDHYTVCYRHN